MYWLKEHPDKRQLLENEINKFIPNDFDYSTLTTEMIENMEYLGYFVKEVLWIDPPSTLNFNQMVYETLVIDDVELL